LILVVALARNKIDLIEKEQVNEDEAKKYAKEVGALFKVISAYNSEGIEELFRRIGCKILNPNYTDENKENDKKDHKIKLGDKKAEKKKDKKWFY